jgi:hypothetical protein
MEEALSPVMAGMQNGLWSATAVKRFPSQIYFHSSSASATAAIYLDVYK